MDGGVWQVLFLLASLVRMYLLYFRAYVYVHLSLAPAIVSCYQMGSPSVPSVHSPRLGRGDGDGDDPFD